MKTIEEGTGFSFAMEQEPTDEERAKFKAAERRRYIRQHAPTILAGISSSEIVEYSDDWSICRAEAIRQAGLIFDETEEA